MKTAADYARQAARFALLAGVAADELESAMDDAAHDGASAKQRAWYERRPVRLRAMTADARWFAGVAALHARRARAGGWWMESSAQASQDAACNAARCAGYAAA